MERDDALAALLPTLGQDQLGGHGAGCVCLDAPGRFVADGSASVGIALVARRVIGVAANIERVRRYRARAVRGNNLRWKPLATGCKVSAA